MAFRFIRTDRQTGGKKRKKSQVDGLDINDFYAPGNGGG
jgi:hypothetical protein